MTHQSPHSSEEHSAYSLVAEMKYIHAQDGYQAPIALQILTRPRRFMSQGYCNGARKISKVSTDVNGGSVLEA